MAVRRRREGPDEGHGAVRRRPVLGWTIALSAGWAWTAAWASAAEGPSRADGRVVLRESVPRGAASRVQIELKAEGLYRPGLPPGQVKAGAKLPKPRSLKVETRLVFSERVLEVDGAATGAKPNSSTADADVRRGRARKSARHVIQAVSAINGEVRPMAAMLRPEVAFLVAEPRPKEGPVVVVSPAGPLTRSELEVVQAVGDPLALSDLLPDGPVEQGAHWKPGALAAEGLSGYDVVTTNGLDVSLEAIDEGHARLRIHGRIEGSALGGRGLITCDGMATYDRRAGWLERIEINRAETREPGPIEVGLDMKSTLTLTRHAERPPATLSNAALARQRLEITPESERLLTNAPDGKASLLHDRHWHGFWDDPKLVVLKRLEGGRAVAQCNLSVGPPAGRGRHQDPAQFRDDVRRALAKRFARFLGAGEIDGDPAGGFRYKVGIQGHEGDLGVVWYYYLLAGPEGNQLVAIFTLADAYARTFGEQDVAMVRTLRWAAPERAAAR